MKYSTKLSDAVHILAFIVLNPNGSLTSDSIAESVHTIPAVCASLCPVCAEPVSSPVSKVIQNHLLPKSFRRLHCWISTER